MQEKKTQKIWTIWNIVEAIILLAAGVLCIIFKDNADLAKAIAFVVGGFVILDGILRILMVILGKQKTSNSFMLVGGFEISFGILIFLQWNNFITIIIQFLFIVLIVIGSLLLIFSIMKIVKKESTLLMPILEIIFSAILIAVGITICIIYNTNNSSSVPLMLIIVGIIFIVTGAGQLTITIIQTKKAKKKSSLNAETIENRKIAAVEETEVKEIEENK